MPRNQADDQQNHEPDDSNASATAATKAKPTTATAGAIPPIFYVAANPTWRPIHTCLQCCLISFYVDATNPHSATPNHKKEEANNSNQTALIFSSVSLRNAEGICRPQCHNSPDPHYGTISSPQRASMKLIFIYGLPATGKLTVAQKLAETTGYKLFHNHLAVDLLLCVFDFGSPPFVQMREEIWLSVFQNACQSGLPGLIFTLNPESTVRSTFIPQTLETMRKFGGQVDFIELTCPLTELKRRIDSPSRLQYRKLNSLPHFEKLHSVGTFDTAHMPKPRLSIDTSLMSPIEAAAKIRETLGLNAP
jgi:hypothetical protein